MRPSNRFRLALNTICLVAFFSLLGIGLMGRHQAIREKQLNSLTDLNDQLQSKLDELALYSFATNNLSLEPVAQPPRTALLRESVGNLALAIKAELQRLAEDQRRGRLLPRARPAFVRAGESGAVRGQRQFHQSRRDRFRTGSMSRSWIARLKWIGKAVR